MKERFLEDGKPIKEVFGDFMKKLRMEDKLLEIELTENWEEIAGSLVARHTTELSFRNEKIILRLDSAPLKQELTYNKSALIDKINRSIGRKAIKELELR